MYPFGAGFYAPESSHRFRGQPPKPAAAPEVLPSRSRSVSASEHELISYIFPDFNAVKYFQKEFKMLNEFYIVEETECSGFEIYLVDQWIRARKIGTVVSAFHGNYESKVKVIKFTIVKKPPKQYPPRFQEYLNEVLLNHATFKKRDLASELGTEVTDGDEEGTQPETTPEFLLVTNITALPSNLNLIPIPGGDTRKVESIFLINSNLRKLNCGGRSVSLIADKVSDASEDKFRQMYRIFNSSVPIKFAIKELVDLIQTCLFYFDLLDARYCDGLLCMKTEDAINSWWNLIGLPHFNTKPNPKAGILPAKTVAAIISLTISVKMRLQNFGGCDVPKDPFDFENFMISIGQFQKQIKIEKKRKLDLITLQRLFFLTNQKFNSDRQVFGGHDLSLADVDRYLYDASLNSSTTSAKSYLSGTHSANPSAYRRNKLHYSKELKKLTNVVKNTVQDHIITREESDNFYTDPVKVKLSNLRSKIASKLSEAIAPADVETIDLDLFVRKFLVGMRLTRLWHGLSSHSGQISTLNKDESKNTASLRQSQHRHGSYHLRHQSIHDRNGEQNGSAHSNAPETEDPKYQFVSLRDKISMNQEFSNQHSDKAGRLGRMKYAFQGKRQNSFQKLNILSDTMSNQKIEAPPKLGGSLVGSELQSPNNDSPKCPEDLPDKFCKFERKNPIKSTFTRRGSYPLIFSGSEASTSIMEQFRNEKYEELKKKGLSIKKVNKSASFSSLEDYFCGSSELYTLEKARADYTDLVSKVLSLEYARRSARRYEDDSLDKAYRHINMELVKLQNMKNHMDTRRAVIDKEYSAVLTGRMKDLKDNIDRMSFRSRDLLKRINELEGNAKKFEFKLHQECNLKLEDIVEGLIHSTKFRKVFKDEDERQKLIYQLSGRNYREETDLDGDEKLWGVRPLIIFMYEMLSFVLQVFNFDRSKMNLDRIRQQWDKLDPNRRYITKAYHFVGRDLVSMLRGSSSSREPGVDGK